MKKNARVLGRQLARELTREELEKSSGSAFWTWTATYPADGPYSDGGGLTPV